MSFTDRFTTFLSLASMLRYELLVYIALRAGFGIWPYIRPSTLYRYRRRETPAWALVTGASHGIGLAFAEELLSRGFNVLIHGRNEGKLEAIKERLSKQHPAESIQILLADAAESNVDYDAIVEKVRSLPGKLTVLINNVGGSPVSPSFVPHEELPATNIDTLINVNARFQTHLTSRLLPILKANSPSVIVCCSSTASLVGMPYIATYSGTKGFVNQFCNSLRTELSSSAEGRHGAKVDVHGLLIGETDTFVNGPPAQPSIFVPRPNKLAAAALSKFGCSKTLVWAYWVHALQYQFLCMLPERIVRMITAKVLSTKRAMERQNSKFD